MVRRNSIALLLAAFLFCSSGCGPSIKTQPLEISYQKRGPLAVVVKSGSNEVSSADVSRMKELLDQSFTKLGYDKVSSSSHRPGLTTVNVVLTQFKHSAPSDNTQTAAGVGCTYVCFLVAPCLLLPGYTHPRFDELADVTASRGEGEIFSKSISQSAVSSANLINSGDEDFRKKLEELTTYNFSAVITRELSGR